MQRMFVDFGDRFSRVSTLLASVETAFLLVTSPEEEILAEAEEFRMGLERLDVAVKGVIVNRLHRPWQGQLPQQHSSTALVKRLRPTVRLTARDSTPLSWLAQNFLAYQLQARGEERRVELFSQHFPADVPLVRVPLLPAFPADLRGLATLLRYLCKETQPKLSHRVKYSPA
jgi:anion-transporting  ArsA/GET3 family ATPase